MTSTTHWIFAYGSNMHHGDLLRWHREHSRPEPVIYETIPAVLAGYRLVWNYYSNTRSGGAANVAKEPGSTVPGLALHVDTQTLQSIDLKEGLPKVYTRTECPLKLRDQRTLQGWVYEVVPQQTRADFVPPHPHYLGLILSSARAYDLDEGHVQWLAQLPTTES